MSNLYNSKNTLTRPSLLYLTIYIYTSKSAVAHPIMRNTCTIYFFIQFNIRRSEILLKYFPRTIFIFTIYKFDNDVHLLK